MVEVEATGEFVLLDFRELSSSASPLQPTAVRYLQSVSGLEKEGVPNEAESGLGQKANRHQECELEM